MKKFVSLLLIVVMLFSLAACGKSNSMVDEGLLTVEVTLDSFFFEGQSEEEIKEAAKEVGYDNCVLNEDGSVTYTMSKAKHRELLREYEASVKETIAELIEGEDKVDSFVNIEYNADFSKFDVYVDAEKYSSWDAIYVLTFYISGVYYQSFAGIADDKIDVKVNFIDNSTEEIIESSSYKEYIENLESDD